MSSYDVVVLGDVNLDLVVVRNLTFPFSSLVQNGLIHWEEIKQLPGGSGLNFCSFATTAGYRCLMLGKVGKDVAGKTVTDWLESHRIYTSKTWVCDLSTGIALIMRDSNDIRLVINNIDNANHELSLEDIECNHDSLATCGVLYVSGYCISNPARPRYKATLSAMELVKHSANATAVVLDVVPHRIHEMYCFDQFLRCTKHVDILIAEVATVRRFLKLGDKDELVDQQMALDTAERISKHYPRVALRYGPSGCEHEILMDSMASTITHRETGHNNVADKRGYGDFLAVSALRDFFNVLPSE